jgi:hypothetical protein
MRSIWSSSPDLKKVNPWPAFRYIGDNQGYNLQPCCTEDRVVNSSRKKITGRRKFGRENVTQKCDAKRDENL